MKFDTRKEAEDYLSGKKVVCLLCGKEFLSLSGHLWRAHEICVKDYKEIFNIPLGMALEGRGLLSRRRKKAKENGLGLDTKFDHEQVKKYGHMAQDAMAIHSGATKRIYPRKNNGGIQARRRAAEAAAAMGDMSLLNELKKVMALHREQKEKNTAKRNRELKKEDAMKTANLKSTSDVRQITGISVPVLTRYAKKYGMKKIYFNGTPRYGWTDDQIEMVARDVVADRKESYRKRGLAISKGKISRSQSTF